MLLMQPSGLEFIKNNPYFCESQQNFFLLIIQFDINSENQNSASPV
jgi:hypothetical protein